MDFDHPPADPLNTMHAWLEDAKGLELPNPNAMTLSTVDADGQPSARIVLLRHLDARGAVFYTNYTSRKGEAIAATTRVALLFFWDQNQRQIRIEGPATRIPHAESDMYFAHRPRGSQIGAWASDQSKPIESRAALEARIDEVEARFADQPVPRPPHWGGYRVGLDRVELWEGREFRVHDRVVYTRVADAWAVERLCP